MHAIEDAFRRGDIEALRRAVDDPNVVPNGKVGEAIGSCLVYAIYHSPLAFVRTLLDLGADPSQSADDGFPPLFAALSMTRGVPGSSRRHDVDDIVRLLLARGADPNQRGVNDYTPLHMAVVEGNLLAVHRLLEAGADPDLRTRIDECETPEGTARAAGFEEAAIVLARRGSPLSHRLRAGLTLLMDVPGNGEPVRRQHRYRTRLRLWLHRGEPVRWTAPSGAANATANATDSVTLDDDGETLVSDIRVNRGSLIAGLFYGLDGMRVGGTRRLEIVPHLAYGDRGVPGVIPAGALLRAEVTIVASA